VIKTLTLAASLGCGLASAAAAQPTVQAGSANSFSEMVAMATEFAGNDLSSLLIVMDDDDTLTQVPCSDASSPSTCQYLGGPAWYSWQQDLIGSGSPYQVADTSDELIAISSMLFGVMDMGFTDPEIPTSLASLTAGNTGAKMLVLTARGGSDVSPTQRQLNDLPSAMSDATFAEFIKDNALATNQSGKPSLASPVELNGPSTNCTSQRAITYTDGVMFVAGQNKGVMLHCLLSRTKSAEVQNIVFLDDTQQNVTDVYNAFVGEKAGPNVLALHYTRLEAHKAALTEGGSSDELQAVADERWNVLRDAILATMLSPLPDIE